MPSLGKFSRKGMRPMKPFGVRLACGAVTILLGALAAAQAQKDRSNQSETGWGLTSSTHLTEPPVPIAASDSYSRSDDLQLPEGPLGRVDSTTKVVEYPSNHDSALGAIQPVQFEQPVELEKPESDADSVSETPPLPDLPMATMPEMAIPAMDIEAPALGAVDASAVLASMPAELEQGTAAGTHQPTPAMAALALPDSITSNSQIPAANESPEMPLPEMSVEANPAPGMQPADMGFPKTNDPPADPMDNGLAASDAHPPALSSEHTFGGDPTNGLRGGMHQQANAIAVQPNAQEQDSGLGYADSQSLGGGFHPNTAAQPFASLPQNGPMPQQEPVLENPQPRANAPFPEHHQAPLADQRIASRELQPGMMPQLPSNVPSTHHSPSQFDTAIAAQPLSVDPNETLPMPGDRRLEGMQSPSVVIQKRAPSEVKVGKPASFVIHVQNVGNVEALDVQVHDQVPEGMRLVDASPVPEQQNGILVWSLGTMPAGDERTVTMQLIPEQEGELGSVARVTFEAAASVRTISTRPELKIVQRAPEKVLIGQQVEIELEVSNPGTGEATGVVLQEDVPEGLEHPKGRELDNLIGNLAPGEVRNQVLRMRAISPGMVRNLIRLTSDDGLTAEHAVDFEVVSPDLQIALAGPSKRYLERPATYQLQIANTGTADASNVEIAVQLDRGFTFVSTDYEGQYDPNRHAVYWSLANLPEGQRGEVPLTLMPVVEGNRKIMIDARADLGVVARSESEVLVESLAELTFQITDSADPIEIGGETTYEIRLTNSGSRNDSNVRVQLQLPQGIEQVSADGNAQSDGRGGLFFAPKPELAANSDVVYRVRVRGVAPGTHLVRAIVTSDQSQVPVAKEESTMVYSDQ